MTGGVSFIVATTGRPTLAATLASIQLYPEDEIIVVGGVDAKVEGQVRYVPHTPGMDWGSTERNFATPLARGSYLAHIDDDDVYAPGARHAMADAMVQAPNRFTIFKMQYPSGERLWREPVVKFGNVGTPMMFMPNDPSRMGKWGEHQNYGDFRFLESMRWPVDEIVWRAEAIAFVSQVHSS